MRLTLFYIKIINFCRSLGTHYLKAKDDPVKSHYLKISQGVPIIYDERGLDDFFLKKNSVFSFGPPSKQK